MELAFIPYETRLALGGIAITLVRVLVTRKNLLEWVTAAQAAREWFVMLWQHLRPIMIGREAAVPRIWNT